MLGTPVRDHSGTIEQEEQEGEADGDNGTGGKCIKLEMERVDKEGPERVTIIRLGFCLGKLEDSRGMMSDRIE